MDSTNEPVAWMDSVGNLTKQNLGDFIPLYTHPAKELRVKPDPKEDEPLFLDYFNTVLNKYCKLYLLLDGTTGDVKETKSMEIRI